MSVLPTRLHSSASRHCSSVWRSWLVMFQHEGRRKSIHCKRLDTSDNISHSQALDVTIDTVIAALEAQTDVNNRFGIYLRCAVHFHHHAVSYKRFRVTSCRADRNSKHFISLTCRYEKHSRQTIRQ